MTPLDRLEWLAAVAADRELWGAPVAVAGALAYLAQHGKCHPGIAGLVTETGVSKATVVRALARLEKRGFVEKKKTIGRGRASTYTLKLSQHVETVSRRRQNGETVSQTVSQTVSPRRDTEWGTGGISTTLSLPEFESVARASAEERERELIDLEKGTDGEWH